LWDPERGEIDAAALEGLDAVVHLAGENIASGRWTAEKRRRIRESRVAGTKLLVRALAGLDRPPAVLVCASAVGFYGDCGARIVDETAPCGAGFLAGLCRDWEEAASAASEAGIRVVRLRIGLVLSAAGGALKKMLPLFRLGLGGRIGHGRQSMSWIALDDLVSLILHCIDEESLAGPVNAVAPGAVTNREFTAALARVLRRPALLPAPAFLLRLALGGMAEELLLSSTRAVPAKALASGFTFRHPAVEEALRAVLT